MVTVKAEKAGDEMVKTWEKIVEEAGGKVTKTTEMGVKQMAYEIGGVRQAAYYNLALELTGEGAVQLRRKLAVASQKGEILRHLLVHGD